MITVAKPACKFGNKNLAARRDSVCETSRFLAQELAMNFRNIRRGLVLTLAFVSMTGCGKSGSSLPPAPAGASAISPDTTVRVHWLGKIGMQLRMNSYYLMRIWQLQVTDDLQTRTLSRLATAPSRWLAVPPERAQLANGLVNASLKDIVLCECYLEVRQPTNQPAELAFAIHLDADGVGNWETNLANIVGLLAGEWPTPASDGQRGWSLHRAQPPNLLQFQRVKDWAVFGAGAGSNSVFNEICDRVRHYRDPFAAMTSTNWLEADLAPSRLADAFSLSARGAGGEGRGEVGAKIVSSLSHVTLAISGDGANVLTRGKLTFPGPMPVDYGPWRFPTNLIPGTLNSFTAVRGLRPWLSSLKVWNDLPIGAPPDQLFLWAVPGQASQAYFVAPSSDAGNQVNRLTEYLLARTNPWLATNGYVQFERLPESNGVSWGNMPSIRPFIKFAGTAGGGAVFGGLLPDTTPGTNLQNNLYQRPARSRLFEEISAQTNLVYYDWELTATRIDPCLYLGQVARVVSRHAQLPLETASLKWLRAVEPGLGSSTTMIVGTGTNQLAFSRKSSVGFTAAELQLLADWLESPLFPDGLYSLPTPP